MSYQTALNLIDQQIIPNASNDITANVLRPVLEAILNAAKETTGLLDDLSTEDNSNLVAAINELFQRLSEVNSESGVMLHTGTADPNTNPPASFSPADFYRQVDSSNATIRLWQYNGFIWSPMGGLTPFSLKAYYDESTITLPSPGFIVDTILNLNNIDADPTATISGTSLTITGGVENGERIFITGKY